MAKRRRKPRQNRHFRIDHELRPEDREPYQAYLREPTTTNKSAHAWLRARGYDFSESAVARHMRHFLAGTRDQRLTEQFAMRYLDLARSGKVSAENFLRASLLCADQAVFEATMSLRFTERDVTPQELLEYAEAIERVVEVRRQLGELAERADPKEESTPEPNLENIADAVRRIVWGRHPGNN